MVCEFMEYLGWFSMAPADQWDTFLKILGIFGAIGLTWWTIYSWRLAKKIELEIELLKDNATVSAHWHHLEKSAKKTGDKKLIASAKKFIGECESLKTELTTKNLSLKALRALNKKCGWT